jgi:hypothetical protein
VGVPPATTTIPGGVGFAAPATSTSLGFSTLSPGAGANSGLNYAAPTGGGSLATAPALPTTPTASTSALASEGGTTGIAGTASNPGGVAP